jgi:hypothetical protein
VRARKAVKGYGCRVAALLLVLAATTPRFLLSQTGLGVQAGLYVPVRPIIDETVPTPRGVHMSQVSAGFIGLRGLTWVKRQVALEGSIVMSPSYVARTDSAGTHDHAAAVFFSDARAVFAVNRRRTFDAGVGLGLVARTGTIWAGRSGTTLPALVWSVGARTPIRRRMAIRLEVQDYITSAQFDQSQIGAVQTRVHHDLLWGVVLLLPLRGRQ